MLVGSKLLVLYFTAYLKRIVTVTPDSVDEADETDTNTVRVRIWKGHETPDGGFTGDPDEVITLTPGTPVLWQDNPDYHSPQLGIDIHPDDTPGTIELYTSDSTQTASGTFKDN